MSASRRADMKRARGFSLVEVVMALGIVAFGLLAVMGLMPVGLSTLRQAMDQTVEAQIVQKLSGQISLTPFTQLNADFSAGLFYYDQEGGEVSEANNASYRVRTVLKAPVYPSGGHVITNGLQQVQIDMTRLPADLTTNRYNVSVPNSGN